MSSPATVPASPSAGFPYVVGATKNNGAPSPTTQSIATIAVGATSSPVFTLLPTKNLVITVKQNGVNLASGTAVTLSITGGPGGTIGALPAWGGALTVNASSQVTVTVPQGTGAFTYTIRAYRTGCGTVRSGVIAAISDSSASADGHRQHGNRDLPGHNAVIGALNRRLRREERGFTLIELTATMAVLGIFFARGRARSRQRDPQQQPGRGPGGHQADARAAVDVLAAELRQAYHDTTLPFTCRRRRSRRG